MPNAGNYGVELAIDLCSRLVQAASGNQSRSFCAGLLPEKELMVYITEVHMSPGGSGHQHIAAVRWRNPGSGETGENTRAQMVTWINEGGDARVRDGRGNDVQVHVVNASPPYIQTYADGIPTDNLLALPRY